MKIRPNRVKPQVGEKYMWTTPKGVRKRYIILYIGEKYITLQNLRGNNLTNRIRIQHFDWRRFKTKTMVKIA